MRYSILVALGVAVLSFGARARADDLVVVADEADSWPAAVAALQGDVHGEGRSLHVHVRDREGDALECGGYTLVLDPVSAQAFVLGACDPATGATSLQLVHRSALFEHDDVAPRPRAAGISAVQVRTGGVAGGARTTGASEVHCSVAVRPYLDDLENARHVFLVPGRFVLRSLSSAVTVEAGADGWVLHSANAARLVVEYEVLDTRRNEVVVHTRATLACAAAEANLATGEMPGETTLAEPLAAPAPPQCAGRAALAPDALVRGTTDQGRAMPGFVIRTVVRRHAVFDVAGDFVGQLDVYRGCDATGGRDAVLRVSPGAPFAQSLTLDPGVYSVVVEDLERRPHTGAFTLRMQYRAQDPEARLH